MPQRKAELRYVNPEMQAMVDERRRAMAKHYSKGNPGLVGNPESYRPEELGFSQNDSQEQALQRRELLMKKIGASMSDSERGLVNPTEDFISRHPEHYFDGMSDKPYDDSLRPEYHADGLKNVNDDYLYELQDRAKSDLEHEVLDNEFENRGYLEMNQLPDGTLQPKWKGPYRR